MINWLFDTSLKVRITRAVMVSISLLMMLALIAAHNIQMNLTRQQYQNEVMVMADVFASKSAAALVFNDSRAADKNLTPAKITPYIERMCIFDIDGKRFAQYLQNNTVPACETELSVPQTLKAALLGENSSNMQFTREVVTNGNKVGYLSISASLNQFDTASQKLAVMMVLIFILAIVCVGFLVFYLVSKALEPLSALRNTTQRLSENPFLPIRAKIYYDDEVGDLVHTFNGMLDRLNEENDALRVSEEALRRSQKMEVVGQLTGGIAHDFNNLLGIMLGSVELLKRKYKNDEEAGKNLSMIEKAVSRAINLTRKLLGFSRKHPTKVENVNLNGVVREMDNLISRAVTPLINVDLRLEEQLWDTAVDPGDLEDALLNLIVNAKDAMPGGGEITITTQNRIINRSMVLADSRLREGEHVVLTISDSGTGFNQSQADKIFEPFYSTKSDSNTGMGLAMVYGFTMRSNGYITAESEPGKGAIFTLGLPRKIAQTEKMSAVNPSATVITGTETILMIDDEEELLAIGKENLEAVGYSVLTASCAQDALSESVVGKDFDIVVSDVVMPGTLNGYELVEEILELKIKKPKVLFCSGYAESFNNVKAKSNWDLKHHLLQKPYSQTDLLQKVRRLLDEPDLHEQ